MKTKLLLFGAYFNFIIAVAHVIGLFWAKQFFEVTGIGKEMERASAIHSSLPYISTIVVAVFFFLFGLYGFSGAGKYRKLPFLKIGLLTIAIIYLIRGIGGFFISIPESTAMPLFEYIYSAIAAIIGLFYYLGWKQIKNKNFSKEL